MLGNDYVADNKRRASGTVDANDASHRKSEPVGCCELLYANKRRMARIALFSPRSAG